MLALRLKLLPKCEQIGTTLEHYFQKNLVELISPRTLLLIYNDRFLNTHFPYGEILQVYSAIRYWFRSPIAYSTDIKYSILDPQ